MGSSPASLKLTFHLDHSVGANHALRSIKQHLLALGPLNRRSRFLGNLADDAISAYTRRIDPFRVVLTGGWTPVSAL
jgi:hypothetical protein